MATPLTSAEWHRLAEQCRARADKLQDQIIRERMLMIADGYDRIAHDAEKDRSPGRSTGRLASSGPCHPRNGPRQRAQPYSTKFAAQEDLILAALPCVAKLGSVLRRGWA